MYWYTGDHHAGHDKIREHARRPFASLEEMVEELVRRHNEVVSARDTVFILGDFAYRLAPRHAVKLLERFKGRKQLIYGNHDRKLWLKAQHKGLLDPLVHSGALRILGDRFEQKITHKGEKLRIVLDHYPIHSWNAKMHGSWHIHGHCHNNLDRAMPHRVDAGVDAWNYYPASLEQILDRGRKLQPVTDGKEPALFLPATPELVVNADD